MATARGGSASEISSLFDVLHRITGGEALPESARTLSEYLSWAEEELSDNTGMVDIRRISHGYAAMQPVRVDPDAEFAIGSSPELPIVPEALVMPSAAMDTGPDLIRVLVAAATSTSLIV